MKPLRKLALPTPFQLVNLICFCPLNPHLLEEMNPEFPGHSLSSALGTSKLSGFIAFTSRIRIFSIWSFLTSLTLNLSRRRCPFHSSRTSQNLMVHKSLMNKPVSIALMREKGLWERWWSHQTEGWELRKWHMEAQVSGDTWSSLQGVRSYWCFPVGVFGTD